MSRAPDELRVVSGLRAGLIGDVAALHGRYYAAHWNFPVFFEAKVASEMAAFCLRYDAARDLVLSVDGSEGRVAGAITLDVSDEALAAGEGHLRWFIIDDAMRGRGLGKRLIADVTAFARGSGLRSIYLTTFRGLDAASKLYLNSGFRVTDEREGATWGRTVVEQRLQLDF